MFMLIMGDKEAFMVSGVNSIDTDSVKKMLADIYNKMSVSDIDGKAGLSQAELASVNPGNDLNTAAFQKVLTEQFDRLDTDKDGQLTESELLNSNVSLTPTVTDPNAQTSASSANFSRMAESCVQKLMNSYKNGGLTSLLSSIHLNG